MIPLKVTSAVGVPSWCWRSGSGGAVVPKPAFRRQRGGVGIDGGDGVRDVVPPNLTSAVGVAPLGVGGVGQGAPSSLSLRSVGHGGVGVNGGDGVRDMVPQRYVLGDLVVLAEWVRGGDGVPRPAFRRPRGGVVIVVTLRW